MAETKVMTKKELIDKVIENEDLSKAAAARICDTIFDALTETLMEGQEVSINGFGKFVIRQRAERMSSNPRTGEKVHVPAQKVVAFRPSKTLKEKVN